MMYTEGYVLSKCQSGEIINSRKDIDRFMALTPAQKETTMRRLMMDSGLTLKQAMPAESVMDPDLLDAVNQMVHIEEEAKRRIATGQVAIDSQSVKKLLSLPSKDQVLVSAILTDPKVESLKRALMVLSGKMQPRTQRESIAAVRLSIRKSCESIEERLKDLKAVGVDEKPLRVVLEKLLDQVNSL